LARPLWYVNILKKNFPNIKFVDAIQMVNEHAVINEECRGCGRCVEVCPQNAIELTIDDDLFVKKSIEQIEKLVDVT